MSAIKREVVIGDCRLLLGDCAAITPLVGPVDAVVTDPPYRFEKSRRKNEARGIARSNETFIRLFSNGLHNGFLLEALPEADNVIVFCAKNQLPELLPAIWAIDDQRWMLIVWNKSKHQHLSGSYAPDTEYALHFWRAGKLARTGLPRFYFGASEQETTHPTEKPVWLMKSFIKATTGVVLDPYMGSGTTGVACARSGRPFIGIEINEQYFDIACERIRKAYAQPDMFVAFRRVSASQLSILDGDA